MNDTKMAVAALMGMTVDNDRGPEWLQAIVSFVQLGCITYLAWYVWRGAEPVERKRSGR